MDGPKTNAELQAELAERSMPIPFSGCLVWLGRVDAGGYGRVAPGEGHAVMPYLAHRLAYEFATGDNLYTDKTGRRHCRECRRERSLVWWRENHT
jgi:hypothetical protein